jgi:hypothetical protein
MCENVCNYCAKENSILLTFALQPFTISAVNLSRDYAELILQSNADRGTIPIWRIRP